MAEEYNRAVSSNWWDLPSSRSSSATSSTTTVAAAASPSSALTTSGGGYGGGWLQGGSGDTVGADMRVARPSMDGASTVAVSASSNIDYPNSCCSQPQVMGLGLSSTHPIDWNQQALLSEKGTGEISSFRSMLQEGMGTNTANFHQEAGASGGLLFGSHMVQWKPTSLPEKPFPGAGGGNVDDPAEFKPISAPRGFSLDQFSHTGSAASTVTCHQQQGSVLSSSSFHNPLDSSSSSVYVGQALIGSNQHQSSSSSTLYGYDHHHEPGNYGLPCNNENLMASSNWTKVPQFLRHTAETKQNQPLHFTNDGPFWNSSNIGADAGRPGFFPSLLQSQLAVPTFEEKPKLNPMEVRDTSGATNLKKSAVANRAMTTSTPTNATAGSTKRSRSEASSTMPPFKVRKEKMGDRITALQQLVSPFGKTDTASVLSEAIEYIKFLHEQVSLLGTPYLKSGSSFQHQQSCDKSKDPEGPRQDLRSRGLCLVPVSSTFPVTHETSVDFWTPTFGGTFR